MVNQGEIWSGTSSEPDSDLADHRGRLGLAAAIASFIISMLTAAFEIDFVWLGLLGGIIGPFFKGREQYVFYVFAAQLLLPIVGFILGGVAWRHGSRVAVSLGAASMLICFLVELDYVARIISSIRV